MLIRGIILGLPCVLLVTIWYAFFTQSIRTEETRITQKIDIPPGYILYQDLLVVYDTSDYPLFDSQDFSNYLKANPTGSVAIKQNTDDSKKGTFLFVAKGKNGELFNATYSRTIECKAYTVRKEKNRKLEKGKSLCTYDFTKNESIYTQNLSSNPFLRFPDMIIFSLILLLLFLMSLTSSSLKRILRKYFPV